MKKLTLLMLILLGSVSISLSQQTIYVGVIEERGNYNEETEDYDLKVIEANITIEPFITKNTTTIKLTFNTTLMNLVNEYIVVDKIIATDSLSFSTYVLVNPYGETMFLQYTDHSFQLLFNMSNTTDDGENLWKGYLKGKLY
jgi:hypothetical protein